MGVCLTCSSLHFAYLVHENVRWLFLLSWSQLPCMPGQLNTYIHQFNIEHVDHAHAHIAHARCDVTAFTYNVNHIMMMSLMFTFHLCHVQMRWHGIIGVSIG